MRATASVSPRISRVISGPSRSSTDSKTTSGSPLRVRTIRSCCWRTRLASSERRALASDNAQALRGGSYVGACGASVAPSAPATNAPQFRTTVTRPSAASTRTACAAVVRLTLYCAASWLAEGSCSPGSHSPRVQSGPQGVGYGLVRDLWRSRHTFQHPPATILARQGCQGRLIRQGCT
jgi:hypothetical protein